MKSFTTDETLDTRTRAMVCVAYKFVNWVADSVRRYFLACTRHTQSPIFFGQCIFMEINDGASASTRETDFIYARSKRTARDRFSLEFSRSILCAESKRERTQGEHGDIVVSRLQLWTRQPATTGRYPHLSRASLNILRRSFFCTSASSTWLVHPLFRLLFILPHPLLYLGHVRLENFKLREKKEEKPSYFRSLFHLHAISTTISGGFFNRVECLRVKIFE